MNVNEEMAYLNRLINQHKKNIYQLEEMLAIHGSEKPLHLVNSLNIERESIERHQKKLEILMAGMDQKEAPASQLAKITNLPRRNYFVGRLEERKDIFTSLQPDSRTFLVGIEGMGGVGKSAIAIEVGYQCLDENTFRSVIWISAKGKVLTLNKIEEQVPDIKTLADMFSTIGDVLGFPTIGNLKFDDQRTKINALLSQQSTLLVIDNLEALPDQEQADILVFLQKTPMTVKAILTSRERIPDGHTVRLRGLPFDESISLLNWDAHQKNIYLSEEQQKKLIDFTGGSPLAMLWVQGQVAVFGNSVDHILDRLYLDSNTPLLQYCFNHSWELLQQTISKKILLTIAINVDPISRTAIKVTNSLDDDSCDDAIGDLIQLSLIYHEADKDYFGLLPLTRRFLRAHFAKNRAFISAIEWRTAQYYANLVLENGSFENWRRYSQLLFDRNNILNAAQWCNKFLRKNFIGTHKKLSTKGEKIAKTLVQFGTQFGSVLWQRAFWYDRLTLAHSALDAARLLDDWRSVSTLSRNIAWIHFYQGDNLRARHWAENSLNAIQKIDELLTIIAAKRSLGTIEIRLGNFESAASLLSDALEISRAYLEKDDYAYYSLGFAQNGMGDLELERGNLTRARDWYTQALGTWQSPIRKDPIRHISYALNGLGFVALKEKKLDEARKHFTESIQAAEQYKRMDELARGKLGLASVLLEIRQNSKEAVSLAKDAIDIFYNQGMQHEIVLAQSVLNQLGNM